jgi:dienelactone hydrolase
MKRAIYFLFVFILSYNCLRAQKPLIDVDNNPWDSFGKCHISNNGEFVAYNFATMSEKRLCIKSIVTPWEVNISGAYLIAFTQDNRKIIFRKNDSVGVLDLQTHADVLYLTDIESSQEVKQGKDSDLLIYRAKQRPGELLLDEIGGLGRWCYVGVENYWVSDDGYIIVLETRKRNGDTITNELSYLDIRKNLEHTFWQGRIVEGLQIGYDDSECVFSAKIEKDTTNTAIWFYKTREDIAAKVLDDHSACLNGMLIKDINAFNEYSGRVFINLSPSRIRNQMPDSLLAPVNVWSYKDPMLQSEQLELLKSRPKNSANFKAVLNLADHHIVKLEEEHEHLSSEIYIDKPINYALVVRNGIGNNSEWNWNDKSLSAVYLINLNNGNRRLVADRLAETGISYTLSYNEHYIFYYDPILKSYCSYKIADSTRKNMTAGMGDKWASDYTADEPAGAYMPYSIAAIIKNTDAILVYDHYDIFELDPASKIQVKNLTGRKRKANRWVFRLQHDIGSLVVDGRKPVCVGVLNEVNKDACVTGMFVEPVLRMDPLHFEPCSFNWLTPVKARDTSIYIVVRMTAEDAPNFYYTDNFNNYTAITDIYPERRYNWMRTELLSWKTFDYGVNQGILYRPENFDSRKKYPLLVYYYERMSDDLHKFRYPGLSDGTLNIPYFVSHGYLVFIPDIHYKIGRPGQSAYKSVVSGVMYLAKRPYIDLKRIGLQGHSFGGFETNYIVTHSSLFAAAMSASGVANSISSYNSIMKDGSDRQSRYELEQSRIGATLWQRPKLYLENSPVLNADKVTTPLLILADQGDEIVPWQQGLEFFLALRRLRKPTWLLDYDGEGHNVANNAGRRDLTIRMVQFFDCYLKGSSPPKWMTVGLPASLKGIDSGLEIDSTGARP